MTHSLLPKKNGASARQPKLPSIVREKSTSAMGRICGEVVNSSEIAKTLNSCEDAHVKTMSDEHLRGGAPPRPSAKKQNTKPRQHVAV
jgi:hypothetical protein